MRTARYAGPSVGQSFDDEVDFAGDLLPQRQRRHSRVGRLGVMPDGEAALGEPLAEPVQKDVAARLGNVENPDPEPVQPLGPRQAWPDRRTSLRCRVEKYGHLYLLAPSAVIPAKAGTQGPKGRAAGLGLHLRGGDD